MSEVPTQQLDETPIDERRFASICEETGRGIHQRILNVLDNVMAYSRTDERLKMLWDNNQKKIRYGSQGTINIGKTSLMAVGKYLKEKGLI